MLATLIIGLREGLEAALIVGIIAAFLRKNGKSLTAMWVGVALAVALSIAVGIVLSWIEQDLPQAEQEGMESVIGAIAVCFVTGMILWMNAHARDMKHHLEAEATAALGATSLYALASMAFLAVLKEGFETSVFLLATFSAAQSAAWAAAGAVIGLLLAVVIGWGIYAGGVRINLARFFRGTGVFLVLVAAGLVVTALRTAHEAGWLNAGQQAILDLSWLVAPGTIRSALLTGVLGIPADPRLIEGMGWLAYIIPVSLLIFWPASRRPGPVAALRLRLVTAAALALLAALLVGFYPAPQPALPARAALVKADTATTTEGYAQFSPRSNDGPPALIVTRNGTATRHPLTPAGSAPWAGTGLTEQSWHQRTEEPLASGKTPLTLDEIVSLNHGRVPIGLSPQEHPGPFQASWVLRRTLDVRTVDDHLTNASEHDTVLVTLTGSGLLTPRTLTAGAHALPGAGDWRVEPGYSSQATQALRDLASARHERDFWATRLPVALLLAALLLVLRAWRRYRQASRRDRRPVSPSPHSRPRDGRNSSQGTLHAPN